MSDNNRRSPQGGIGNANADIQNLQNQYVSLGFSTSTNNSTDSINRNQQTQSSFINQNVFNLPSNGQVFNNLNQQYPQPSYSFVQPSQIFVPNVMPEFNGHVNGLNQLNYDMFQNIPSNSIDVNPFESNYKLGNNQNVQIPPENVLTSNEHGPSQLIENLVGNWISPNISGTYSPFGNLNESPTSHKKIVNVSNVTINPDVISPEYDDKFQFSRENRKPRMVAEVKPMRPSYSDVLSKSVPATKPTKNEVKDSFQKKEVSKKNKIDKNIKLNQLLNRSNTNNDLNIKDLHFEKNSNTKNNSKTKNKNEKLERKWASLDNINESGNKNEKIKKKDVEETNKSSSKNSSKKKNNNFEANETESGNSTSETYVISKNGVKKNNKVKSKMDTLSNERSFGKKSQRTKRKDNNRLLGILIEKCNFFLKEWWKISFTFIFWIFQLISDICSLSVHISQDFAVHSWNWLKDQWTFLAIITVAIIKRQKVLMWIWNKFKKKEEKEEKTKPLSNKGLQHNMSMPTTGDEAMKRLLACKGKDPYSILGVSPGCTDEDIKRYYKRQAFLVHPDKNPQPGAEEAFKILVHAFDMIGVPERRAAYDRGVAESVQVEQAWSELTELLAQLQKTVEAAANTIRCSSCNLRHKRVKVNRPIYAARNCATCKIHHSAREGDIWAEAQCFGLLWHYFACMEGGVYDITEWAGCQKDSLKHLKPDSHHVQYRIALGKNNPPKRHTSNQRTDKPPDLENLLNTLYGQTDTSQASKKK